MKTEDVQNLIAANHVLHNRNVVDAYGHVSLRHPENPDIFIISGDRASALVPSKSHLIEYYVSDASPVDTKAKKGYQERFIHSEIYKRFPYINSVIHSHSEAVLPYTMSGVVMRPTFHTAGFLDIEVPTLYEPGNQQDMLVNSEKFGLSLASTFSKPGSSKQDHNVVLITNHGFTTVGTSVKQAVYRAVYTHANANVQSNVILLRNAQLPNSGPDVGESRYLNEDQVAGSLKMNDASQDRPWGLWVREVEASPMYVDEIKEADPTADVD